MFSSFFPLVIVGITCAILIYVALVDWKDYKINNESVVLIAALYFLYVFATGTWSEVWSHVAISLAIFLVMLVCFKYGLLGGGDAKLLTVAFLWAGLDCASLFSVSMLAISALHAGLVHFGLAGAQTINGRRRIPYAPAIAGALLIVFTSGCFPHSTQ
jgi:prepilin peptidase CpaA